MSIAGHYQERLGWNSDIQLHLPYLHQRVLDADAQTVVELGVRSGMSTAALLAAVEETGGHLWSVDIVWPQVPDEFVTSNHWTLLTGNDIVLAEHLPASIDVLFIDTSHEYEHTLAELRTFGPRVRPGGVILLHDTELEHPDGVTGSAFPVSTAVTEWCTETGLDWTNRPGSYGLGVIEIPQGE